MKMPRRLLWAMILSVSLGACATSGEIDDRYARTPQFSAPAPATQQEAIEQELEPAEVAELRQFLETLPSEHRRALVSVIAQLEEGYRGLAVIDKLVRNPATGTKLARVLSLMGKDFEGGLASSISADFYKRWPAFQPAFDANIDESILAETLRLFALNGYCFYDEAEHTQVARSIADSEIKVTGITIGMCDQSVVNFDRDWNEYLPAMVNAWDAPDGVATYQIQLMRAGKDRDYYHQPKRGRYEIEQYGRKLEDFERDHICGAVYIGGNYALTAAHCVEGWKGYDGEFFAARRIRAGTNDIGADAEDKEVLGEIIPIKSVVVHSKYKDGKAYAGFDIALLKLGRTPKKPRTSLAILPKVPRNGLNSGAKLVQTGWGLTGATRNSHLARDIKGNLQSASRYLRIGEMGLYENSKCNEDPAFKKKKVTLKYGQLCVGSSKGVDACRGDSGGPLVQDRKGQDPVLVGLVSWGIGCGIKNRAAIYTDVGTFYAWILLAKDAARDGRFVYLK